MDPQCPKCGANLDYEVDGVAYSHAFGVQIRGVYDGVLFWQCPFCDGRWHRFPVGDYRHTRAIRYVETGEETLQPSDDFYEPDEPIDDIMKAFERGEKGKTGRAGE